MFAVAGSARNSEELMLQGKAIGIVLKQTQHHRVSFLPSASYLSEAPGQPFLPLTKRL